MIRTVVEVLVAVSILNGLIWGTGLFVLHSPTNLMLFGSSFFTPLTIFIGTRPIEARG